VTDEHILELWHERAAIMEHDGGLSRKEAERRAYWEIRKLIGKAPVPKEIRDAARVVQLMDVSPE
jgi:hypothetical protein